MVERLASHSSWMPFSTAIDDREDEARSPKLTVLKRVARVVVRANGVPARRKDPLNETIKKFLGVSERLSAALRPQQRYNLAVRLIMLDDEQDALDYVGFALIGLFAAFGPI